MIPVVGLDPSLRATPAFAEWMIGAEPGWITDVMAYAAYTSEPNGGSADDWDEYESVRTHWAEVQRATLSRLRDAGYDIVRSES